MQCDEVCHKLGLPGLFPTIFSPEPRRDLVSLHCVLFSIQYASAKAWLDCGLVVDRMIGHSFGQLTAICVAGGLSLIDGLRLISQRAALIQNKWGAERGVMLSLKATKTQVQELLRAASGTVEVACFNGPESFVLAGDEKSITNVEALCAQRDLERQKKRLRNTHAFHSRLVDPLLAELSQIAEALDYKPLRISVEACSDEPDHWVDLSASKVVRHSREPVYFHPAVQRTLRHISGPCVWLEAGSGSPIVGMLRRVVEASGPTGEHTYLPIDLQVSTAEGNLADVTRTLWSKGVPVQFWPFHRSQPGYKWINLPPYQFSKTQHWIDYDPYAFQPIVSVAEANKNDDELLRLVKREPNGCLFAINNQDPAYRMCTEGHAVVDQNLCPASLYVEIVVRGAMTLSDSGQAASMAHIEALNISAPLVVDMPGSVCLSLTNNNHGGWMFSLFSQDGDHPPITHATGKVSFEPQSAGSPASSRFHSLNRLLDPGQFESIAQSPSSNGLKRATVYQAFRRAVNYADYYRGVEEVYGVGHKAAGRVLLPSSPTRMAACDPILMDNFLQVAGIHVNCLSETNEDEVFVCSFVGEVSLGSRFLNRDAAAPKAWTVYSTYERESEKKVTCDVFALDEDRTLAVAIMSATFTSVSIQSLKRTLSRLNGHNLGPSHSSSLQHEPLLQENVPEQLPPAAHITISDNDHLRSVQSMLGDLLGVSPGELPGDAPLTEIGVDSLMSTEVLAEVDKRFGVRITNSELADIADVRALAHRIFPSSSVVHVETSKDSALAIDISIRGQKPIIESPPVVNPAESPQLIESAITTFAASRGSTKYADRTLFAGFATSVYPRQMQLVTAYVVEAFQALGAKLDSILPGQTIPSLAILPQHTQVLGQLIRVLEYTGLVERKGTGIFRTSKPVDVGPSTVLHQTILDDYPHHASEHKLLHTTGARLAECLTGTADPLSLLFQDAQARALMQDVYSNAPMFRAATMQLAQYLQDLLLDSGCDREIEILEIGAGTGGTTAFLVSQLAAIPGVKFKYTFTDLSSSLVTLARKRFSSYSFMRYSTLDIEKMPREELLGKYDIILSSNCIHATRSLATSCRHIRKMLHPHGILCLIELTRNLPWFDLVFGLLEGWWLFNDGRSHALANESLWEARLGEAGFNWVDWTDNALEESDILRLIVASATRPSTLPPSEPSITAARVQTVTYAERDGLQLMADIYYPHAIDAKGTKRPIALLIHGGGHIMLSRKDIRPAQVDLLLDAGFLPVSIDYRLCPEVSLLEGPMPDVRDALAWARADLPHQSLSRSDIQPDGDYVVAVGWSTGGHLAMTLAWTTPEHGVRPPQAILAFYGPTDYTDPFWTTPNFPYAGAVSEEHTKLTRPLDALHDSPITAYNPPPNKQALGGWMAPSDPRSQIALYMNWTGQALSVLFNGCNYKQLAAAKGHSAGEVTLSAPPLADIQRACPFSQIVAGRYRTPTFLIHGSLDDLIPVEQAQRTQDALRAAGVESTLRVVEGGLHLFDLGFDLETNETTGSTVDEEGWRAVREGYAFLRQHVAV
jgi:acetyl esterase/lipase/2-polyprenyl-3-methyl-5-hydroxy-6-metoxy-1,4-benzoquinol methylase/acyl carrier protein